MNISGPKPAAREDLPKIVRLVDSIFRSDYGHNTSMADEFPILFREPNLRNLRIISDGDDPVATFCMYPSVLSLYGSGIPCAFVGSVSTHRDYRGQGFAGMLFEDAERLLVEQGIDLMLVSGDRSLYLRHGCTRTAPFRSFVRIGSRTAPVSVLPAGWEHCTEDTLSGMQELYAREDVRFLRPDEEFRLLSRGFSYEFPDKRVRSFLFRPEGRPVAYVVLSVRAGTGTVREYAGSREDVVRFFENAERFVEVNSINLPVMEYDGKLAGILDRKKTAFESKSYEHTLKVLNYPSLMKKLAPFFLRTLKGNELSSLVFERRAEGYVMGFEGDVFVTKDIDVVNEVVFNPGAVEKHVPGSMKRLSGILARIFPVPVPYLQNMNYI